MASLCCRFSLECDHFRTAPRSLIQGQSLDQEYIDGKAPVARRMDLFFASGMKPIWTLRAEMASLMFHLDMVKDALETYTKLGLWEEAIMCYRRLDLNHKVRTSVANEIWHKVSR